MKVEGGGHYSRAVHDGARTVVYFHTVLMTYTACIAKIIILKVNSSQRSKKIEQELQNEAFYVSNAPMLFRYNKMSEIMSFLIFALQ